MYVCTGCMPRTLGLYKNKLVNDVMQETDYPSITRSRSLVSKKDEFHNFSTDHGNQNHNLPFVKNVFRSRSDATGKTSSSRSITRPTVDGTLRIPSTLQLEWNLHYFIE